LGQGEKLKKKGLPWAKKNLAFLSELLLEPNLKLCCLKVIKSGVIAWSEKKR